MNQTKNMVIRASFDPSIVLTTERPVFPKLFSLQHPTTGLFVSMCGSKLCLKGSMVEEQLYFVATPSMTHPGYVATQSEEGEMILKLAGKSQYIRQLGNTMVPYSLEGPFEAFALRPYLVSGCSNAVVFQSFIEKSISIGYDPVTDTVKLVRDPHESVAWRVVTSHPAYMVEQNNKAFYLKDQKTGSILSKCQHSICLRNGDAISLKLTNDKFMADYSGFGYQLLRVVESNKYLRHEGFVVHEDDLIGSSSDFAFLLERNCGQDSIVIHSPAGDFKYDLGYDSATNKVMIVRRGDPRVISWEMVYI